MSSLFQVITDLAGWFFGVCFLLLSLGLFFNGSIVGGIASLLFGLGITPLARKLLTALHMSPKVSLLALACLFLVSFGALAEVGSGTESESSLAETSVEVEQIAEGRLPDQNTGLLTEAETEENEKSDSSEGIEESDEPEHTGKTEEREEPGNVWEPEETQDSGRELEIHFIDVGQGDATLIISGEHAMLIDAGDDSKGTKVQHYLQNQGVESLDYLVLTHTDADHIGGADVIVNKFDIEKVFLSDFRKDNSVYQELMQALEWKGLSYSTPAVGENYALGNAFFTVLAPNRIYEDPNNSSIALLLQNGANKFLFTGDGEQEAEKDILANGLDLDCDVLKAGHHGSSTSSSAGFLNAATPAYAVISCEENNKSTMGSIQFNDTNSVKMA